MAASLAPMMASSLARPAGRMLLLLLVVAGLLSAPTARAAPAPLQIDTPSLASASPTTSPSHTPSPQEEFQRAYFASEYLPTKEYGLWRAQAFPPPRSSPSTPPAADAAGAAGPPDGGAWPSYAAPRAAPTQIGARWSSAMSIDPFAKKSSPLLKPAEHDNAAAAVAGASTPTPTTPASSAPAHDLRMAVAVHNAPLADVAVDERQLEQDLATPSFEIIADDRVRWAHHGVDAGVLHPSPSVAPPPAARATSVPSAPLLPAPAPMPSHAAAIAPLVETHSELGDVRSKPAKHMPHLRAGEATIE